MLIKLYLEVDHMNLIKLIFGQMAFVKLAILIVFNPINKYFYP
jgi:hypothetical protein